MDWKQSCRARLPHHLDPRGDLAPPWERFPTYERHTIGWRMGGGEDWMGLFGAFLDSLDPAPEARLAFLRRHAPAPVSWADYVHSILHPEDDDEDDPEDTTLAARRAHLLERGLIASDVAYHTWLGQQEGVRWPWGDSETPQDAARYWTRELWFWSRRVASLRADPGWALPPLPDAWQPCAAPLATGEAGELDLDHGLLSLACMLAAGRVIAPWQLGLGLGDFADSFDDDMGYVDAFRLWGMSAFDDREHVRGFIEATGMPEAWAGWVEEHFPGD